MGKDLHSRTGPIADRILLAIIYTLRRGLLYSLCPVRGVGQCVAMVGDYDFALLVFPDSVGVMQKPGQVQSGRELKDRFELYKYPNNPYMLCYSTIETSSQLILGL